MRARSPKQLVLVLVIAGAVWAGKRYFPGLFGGDNSQTTGQQPYEEAPRETPERLPEREPESLPERRAPRETTTPSRTTPNKTARIDPGAKLIIDSFRAKRSKVWVESEGKVVKRLRDDNKGSRHQLFLVEIQPKHTIKISHNIDLAPYIHLREGDTVRFRGRFEYNIKGGVVHWTHHDPKRKDDKKWGGWIEHNGKIYR